MTDKEKWIENVMNSLDGLEPAQGSTRLYQKVKNRIENDNSGIHHHDRISHATVWRIAAGLFFIVALNVATCIVFTKHGKEQMALRSLAKEYSLGPETYNY